METTAQQPKRMMPRGRVRGGLTASDLPLRPRFLSEIVVAPWDNGIVADGSGRLVVLEGNATKGLIPDLMRLMDGTRTVDELYSELDTVPEQDVTAAISVLKHSGLVADCGEMDYELKSVNRNSLSFMERFIGVTNDARNGLEAYSRLQSSSIVLISPGRSTQDTERLAKLLEGTGAGSVTCLAAESARQLKSDIEKLPDNALVVVLSLTPEDRGLGLLADSCCKQMRLSWLRAGLSESGTSFDIGPFFGARRAPCYSCFLAAHSHVFSSQLSSPPMTVLAAEFWLGLVASEIVFHRTRMGDCLTAARFRRYSLAADSSQALTVFRTPGCMRCCPIAGPTSEETKRQSIPTALVYEDYIAVQQRPASDNTAKEIQAGQLAVLREATRQIKELPYCEHVQLTRSLPNLEHGLLDLLRCECSEANRELGQEELGQILMMSVGIRRFGRSSGMIKRWGATGGNLGSVEAFVAVNHVKDVQPGLYFYQARDHSLARLDDDSTPVADFITAATGIMGDKPDAVIILTGAYHRLSRKYGSFAYKLMNFDAGVAASQLGLVGSALGTSVQQLRAWDDHVIEKRLRLEPFQEQVTNVVLVLSAKDDQALTSRPNPTSTLFRCDDAILSSREDVCGDSVEAVTKRLYRESRLRQTPGTESIRNSKRKVSDHNDGAVAASFPALVQGGRSLGEVLSHRASIRQYTEDPVSNTQLAGMLASAYEGDRHDWREESQAFPLQFLVLASRVEGVAPGAYLYDPSQKALRHWRSDYMPERRGELFIQEEFSSAPLTIWVSGPLAAACESHGGFGHRQLLLRAGAAVHRCWMAALSLGMQGCPVAGIVPVTARELLGLDGYVDAPLLSFTAGHTSFEQLRQPRTAARNMP